MDREQIIGEIEKSISTKDKNQGDFSKLKIQLNEIVEHSFFAKRHSDVSAVINHIIKNFKLSGDLMAKSQSMTIENYILLKIWEDVNLAAVKDAGAGFSQFASYINYEVAGDDTTNSQLVINFLTNLLREINDTSTYADFVVVLLESKNILFDLKI